MPRDRLQLESGRCQILVAAPVSKASVVRACPMPLTFDFRCHCQILICGLCAMQRPLQRRRRQQPATTGIMFCFPPQSTPKPAAARRSDRFRRIRARFEANEETMPLASPLASRVIQRPVRRR